MRSCKHLTYANVMSSLAVFLILTGATAFAAAKISGKRLKSGSVTTAKLRRNSVTTPKIRNNAFLREDQNNAITTAKIGDGAVSCAKIATGTNVIATGRWRSGPANSATQRDPTHGTTTFHTPGRRGRPPQHHRNGSITGANINLSRATPFVNGNAFEVAEGFRPFAPLRRPPTSPVVGPVTSETSPGSAPAPDSRRQSPPKCWATRIARRTRPSQSRSRRPRPSRTRRRRSWKRAGRSPGPLLTLP